MKGSSADYHQEMNAVNFEKWFEDKLLPALPASSLIVMDNASYHRYVLYSPQSLLLFVAVATWRSNQSKSGEKHN